MSEEHIEQLRLANNRIEAELHKLMEESAKLRAEANWLDRQHLFYPIIVGASIFGAGSAFTLALSKLV